MIKSIGWAFGFAMLALLGCGANQKKSTSPPAPSHPSSTAQPSAQITNTDPCAMRLHDICGPLLLFYGTHRRIPSNLQELKDEFSDLPELVCPVSKLPYVYDPEGKVGTDPRTRIILYDAKPVHSGIRWGIGLVEAEPGAAPVAKVVAVPNQTIPMTPR
ncbi:MAG TPA: hypothetical protein VL282_10315 [Tepidisphaeraceae bacterium]|jgi:hypothetical protein|nr:hypothetical protein [Tepidisphaeraceae bacterium]